ncbi:putative membrane protein [Stenotrophomonas phage Sonora]|nr:putative membrane protein [Stenotrophomonas phage Sonora]
MPPENTRGSAERFDPSDPIQVAVRMTELEMRLDNSLNIFRISIDGLRGDLKEVLSAVRSRDEDFETWRTAHEEDNRKTRERLIMWSGVATGISILATALVGAILAIYTGDKAALKQDFARLERTQATDATRIESNLNGRADANAAAIREIERYLTQEGTVSGRPYVPNR